MSSDPEIKIVELSDGVAGRSKDGKTVYIDKLVPKGITSHAYAVHEIEEHKQMLKGVPYTEAHILADKAEKRYVVAHGGNWKEHQDFYHELLEKIQARSPKPKDPADMFYGDEGEKEKNSKGDNVPIHACTEGGKPGQQWGDHGKCFTHDGTEAGIAEAKKKAAAQAGAAYAHGYKESNAGCTKCAVQAALKEVMDPLVQKLDNVAAEQKKVTDKKLNANLIHHVAGTGLGGQFGAEHHAKALSELSVSPVVGTHYENKIAEIRSQVNNGQMTFEDAANAKADVKQGYHRAIDTHLDCRAS